MFRKNPKLRKAYKSDFYPYNSKGLVIAYTDENGRKYGRKDTEMDSIYEKLEFGRVFIVKWGSNLFETGYRNKRSDDSVI